MHRKAKPESFPFGWVESLVAKFVFAFTEQFGEHFLCCLSPPLFLFWAVPKVGRVEMAAWVSVRNGATLFHNTETEIRLDDCKLNMGH